MELTRAIDGYCERLGPEYWAEPVNALTNLAFIIAGAVMWPRTGGEPLARALATVLFLIGIGSWLFHTHAQVWAAIADTLAIVVYVLIYIYAINRHGWALSTWMAGGVTTLFVPYVAVLVPVLQQVPFLNISAGYWPLPLMIGAYAVMLYRRDPALARGLGIGAAVLVASLVFRSLDEVVCRALPLGTHFMWHILNAIMLAWMIEVFLRLRARQRAASSIT